MVLALKVGALAKSPIPFDRSSTARLCFCFPVHLSNSSFDTSVASSRVPNDNRVASLGSTVQVPDSATCRPYALYIKARTLLYEYDQPYALSSVWHSHRQNFRQHPNLGPGQFRGFQTRRPPNQNPVGSDLAGVGFDLAGVGFETHGTDQGLIKLTSRKCRTLYRHPNPPRPDHINPDNSLHVEAPGDSDKISIGGISDPY